MLYISRILCFADDSSGDDLYTSCATVSEKKILRVVTNIEYCYWQSYSKHNKNGKCYISTFNVRSLANKTRVPELEYAISKISLNIINIAEMRRVGYNIEDRRWYRFYYYDKKRWERSTFPSGETTRNRSTKFYRNIWENSSVKSKNIRKLLLYKSSIWQENLYADLKLCKNAQKNLYLWYNTI